jgi:hypothetical protein
MTEDKSADPLFSRLAAEEPHVDYEDIRPIRTTHEETENKSPKVLIIGSAGLNDLIHAAAGFADLNPAMCTSEDPKEILKMIKQKDPDVIVFDITHKPGVNPDDRIKSSSDALLLYSKEPLAHRPSILVHGEADTQDIQNVVESVPGAKVLGNKDQNIQKIINALDETNQSTVKITF